MERLSARELSKNKCWYSNMICSRKEGIQFLLLINKNICVSISIAMLRLFHRVPYHTCILSNWDFQDRVRVGGHSYTEV